MPRHKCDSCGQPARKMWVCTSCAAAEDACTCDGTELEEL